MPTPTLSNPPISSLHRTNVSGDPLASANTQFGLSRPPTEPTQTAGSASPVGLRPWGLRAVQAVDNGPELPEFRYCHLRQLTVDTDDQPVIDTTPVRMMSEVSELDGKDGSSKDYSAKEFTPGDDLPGAWYSA